MYVSESTWFVIAIIIYLLAMLLIGFWSYRRTTDYSDYMLADRGLNPFVAAMSAGASDMSGWLLMGLPGALFITGLSETWMPVGLAIGTWANWTFIAPRLRACTEAAGDSITLPSFFENRLHDRSRSLRIVAALIIIFFFTFYVSSGMVSGGRYFEATFDGEYLTGMLIVGAVTVAYTFFGGFLAVSYTDAVQGLLMLSALLVVPIMAVVSLSNPIEVFSFAADHAYGPWESGNPTYFSLFAGVSVATIIGNIAWGLGYFGQPHILVRFMALRSPAEAKQGRFWGVAWVVIAMAGAVATAMIATVYFQQTPGTSITDQVNYETIFLDLARVLFHPLIVGIVLTAVLAAIMSTMSSQLLVVSSSLIEDLAKIFVRGGISERAQMNLARIAVLGVAIVAAALAVVPNDSILGLVGFAWAGFGSAFGPVVIASLYWRRLTATGALAGMVAGAVVSVWWSLTLGDVLYEMIPGVLAASIVMIVVSLTTKQPAQDVVEDFDAYIRLLDSRSAAGEEA